MGLSEYLKKPWMRLFYFFNLMLEIQTLHVMEEGCFGEGWGSRKHCDLTLLPYDPTSRRFAILHIQSFYSLSFDYKTLGAGVCVGHMLSLLQIKTNSPNVDGIRFTIFSLFMAHSLKLKNTNKTVVYHSFPDYKSSHWQRFGKYRNLEEYICHISFLLTFSECFMGVWSLT